MNTKTKVDDRVNRLVLIIGTDVLPRRELIAALELSNDQVAKRIVKIYEEVIKNGQQ